MPATCTGWPVSALSTAFAFTRNAPNRDTTVLASGIVVGTYVVGCGDGADEGAADGRAADEGATDVVVGAFGTTTALVVGLGVEIILVGAPLDDDDGALLLLLVVGREEAVVVGC
mmetsp:Transcript_1625/g.4844  ORF Transcript_1625/g.4844 Transcript_1625/m.4844 type:complete len:115 (-) Transcript_1625:429-773(-)